MKPLMAIATVLVISGCSTLNQQNARDSRGYVMDHASAVEQGGVGNYTFRDMTGAQNSDDLAALSEEEEYWTTSRSSPDWEPAAEFDGQNLQISEEVRFKLGSAELTDRSKRILDDVADVIMNNDEALRSIEVAGHTDPTGSRHRNEILSAERAETVRNYLISRGVSEEKLIAVGYGFQQPKFDPANSSPAEIAKNRRVEFRAEATVLAE